MLQPKRVKYRKPHAPKSGGLAHSGNTMLHGDFGLKAMEPAWITARQIEAARRAITHHLKRGGKVWIRIFPDYAITAKPAETRVAPHILHRVWAACRAGSTLELYVVEGGGHTWPNGTQYWPVRLIGVTTRQFDAGEVLWQFLQQHPST